jgi:hypothetical protein
MRTAEGLSVFSAAARAGGPTTLIFWAPRQRYLRKFLSGGEFRHFKINQFEKIIKSLLSSLLICFQRKYDHCIRAENPRQWIFKKTFKRVGGFNLFRTHNKHTTSSINIATIW